MSLEQAVIDAGAVRFRPMALTVAAVIIGAGVILFQSAFTNWCPMMTMLKKLGVRSA